MQNSSHEDSARENWSPQMLRRKWNIIKHKQALESHFLKQSFNVILLFIYMYKIPWSVYFNRDLHSTIYLPWHNMLTLLRIWTRLRYIKLFYLFSSLQPESPHVYQKNTEILIQKSF